MLTSAKSLLVKARKNKYAVPAFNINNLEILKAVIEAAVSLRSPVIVQTSEGAIQYAGMPYLIAMVRVAAEAPIPVVLHLDHGKNLALIHQAIRSGYTSVMFDGSTFPYKENVSKTQQVIRWARSRKISVEAELGVLAGKEDFVNVKDHEVAFTDPKQAQEFVNKTNCDSLAIAIGTSHGAYKFKHKTSHLDIERLKQIARQVKIPIVLHGASGVLEDVTALAKHYGARLGDVRGILDRDIQQAIQHGVAKINIDTDLRLAFTAGIREAVREMPTIIDPRELLEPASKLMTDVAKRKMKLFRSVGNA